jgi:hypothetical protein
LGQRDVNIYEISQNTTAVTGAVSNTSTDVKLAYGTVATPPCSSTFGCDLIGKLDDIRIYNYALTPAQIKNVYNENSAIRFGP